MKKFCKGAASLILPISMFLFGSVGASAAEATEETVSESAATTSAVATSATTETSVTTRSAAVTSAPAEDVSTVTSVPEADIPDIEETSADDDEAAETAAPLENPFEDGMLADDELFEFISEYLNDGVSFDVDGTGVLIGEDILNPEPDEEAAENEDGEQSESKARDYSEYYTGEKLMYTVATRDGNIFYIIIDKSGAGENVYFLNSVDFTDLAALIDTDKESYSKAEKEILQAASGGGVTVEEAEGDENPEADSGDVGTVGESSRTETPVSQTSSGGNNTLYIIVGVVAIGIIGVAAYFKVGPGKKKRASKSAFEDDEDEDGGDEEEYYIDDDNDDSDEEHQSEDEPQEDSYDDE